LLKRRYNQSALLAAELSIHCGVPHVDDLLVRIRRTTPHENMDRTERERKVKRAFAVRDHYAEKIIGKTIVLVDDVYTTGSTVAECSRTMLRAGAAAVRIATVARVFKAT
jgi:predicted amidophosphoribosyltransferase